MTVDELAALILAETKADMLRRYPDSPHMAEWERVSVKPGPVYTKIDTGAEHNMSGKYMVENVTGIIFGIKGYGKVHRGHCYGTLDTVHDYIWGGYTARKKEQA